jgi:hypothetical protein
MGKAVIVFHEHDAIPNQPVRGLRENLKISRYWDNLTKSFSCVGQRARVGETVDGFSVWSENLKDFRCMVYVYLCLRDGKGIFTELVLKAVE